MGTPKGGEIAGRLRAARGYAGLDQRELAKKLGISVETVSRMENGKTTVPNGTPALVADICEVPALFMELGFVPLEQPLSEAEKRILEAEDSLARQITALQVADVATQAELQRLARAIEALGKGSPPAERPGDDR